MKMNPRPNGTTGGKDIPNAGNRTGVTDTYGGGLDKGYQGGMSITGACKSDKPEMTKSPKRK